MPPTKRVPIELGGKRRFFRYTNTSLIRIEEQVDWTIQEVMERADRGSLRAIVALVWAGLLHDEPDLAYYEAAELFDPARAEEIIAAATEAITAAYGGDEEKPAKQGKKAAPKQRASSGRAA